MARYATMENFDPNALPPTFVTATFVPDRTPQFKLHRNKGHATNAWKCHARCIRYEWDAENRLWVEVARKTKHE